MHHARRILDNLPVGMVNMRKSASNPEVLIKTYERGFPIGFRATVEASPQLGCIPSFQHPSQRLAEAWHAQITPVLFRPPL